MRSDPVLFILAYFDLLLLIEYAIKRPNREPALVYVKVEDAT
jgi:hypothetical protein